jgi:hypothetical protein
MNGRGSGFRIDPGQAHPARLFVRNRDELTLRRIAGVAHFHLSRKFSA